MRLLALLTLVAAAGAAPAHAVGPWLHGHDGEHISQSFNFGRAYLAFDEEFDDPGRIAVSGAGPWYPGVHAVLAEGEKMAGLPDPAIKVEDGLLALSTRVDPADGRRIEAHIQTLDALGDVTAFEDGYIEIRAKLPAALGSHAGAWLLGREEGQGHPEFDIMETYGVGDWFVHSSSHTWPGADPDAPAHAYASTLHLAPDLYADFHTFGVKLDREWVTAYFDGRVTGMIKRDRGQHVPLYILLSVFGNPAQPVIEDATMLVDYVRVYRQS